MKSYHSFILEYGKSQIRSFSGSVGVKKEEQSMKFLILRFNIIFQKDLAPIMSQKC